MGSVKIEDGQKKDGIDLDHILEEEVGQFGPYQIMTMALLSLPVIFAAFASGEYIFTTARIPTRCIIPQCDGPTPDFSPSWLSNAIPSTDGSFDNCRRFTNSSNQDPGTQTCPASLFQSSVEDCGHGHLYEHTNTVVYDFDMACDEWRRSRIGSIRNIGTLLVLPITGYISDRWGRRVALTINAFNTAWLGLVRAFVNSYEWFLALEVIEATVGSGAFSSCYILALELVGPKYRVLAGASISTIFALGQIILGFIAWGVQAWRPLTQIVYAPQLLMISYFWIVSESVRWLMSKGRYEEAEQILMKVAKTNKKELSQKSLQALRDTAEAEKNVEKPKEEWLLLQVLKSRVILSRCVVSPIWWITNTLVYFGMTINSVNLVGNSYLNFVVVAAVEIPGYWTAILLLDRVGRKPVLITGYWICAVCQFIFAFAPEGMDSLTLAVYLIGKYCISAVITSTYVYTAEIYPTKYRHSLLGFSSMIGRLGSITAPLMPSLALTVWGPLPSVIFGSLALISGLLLFTTPETLGTNLPDTIEEAEHINRLKKTVL